ncbi:MAG: hypothetical protein ACOH2N_11270 [Devosia sp.]
MSLEIRVTGDFKKFNAAIKALGETKATSAYRMALNDTNKAVFTQVKRTLAKQVGVSQAAVVKHGKVRKKPASGGNLAASIESEGGYLLLKDFKPLAGAAGVKANPWAKRTLFGGTFQIARAGANVFKRTNAWNKRSERFNGVEKLYGPAVPKEIVKGTSADAFNRIAETKLPAEIARQLKRLSGGVIS